MKHRFKKVRRFVVGAVALCVVVGAGISTPFTPNTGPSLLILGDSITWGTEYFAKSLKLIQADGQCKNVVIDC